eukprot:TRINITY_DN11025_c0_g1_i10.p1 TRINITY_DN11025_c0_g1~~TRINITY_DN11025_c0_g1_i10.p1  ORF type:complete len:654 (-),score=162.15 TRINITY_DN11025_c0_g1_i10:236-2197(-)
MSVPSCSSLTPWSLGGEIEDGYGFAQNVFAAVPTFDDDAETEAEATAADHAMALQARVVGASPDNVEVDTCDAESVCFMEEAETQKAFSLSDLPDFERESPCASWDGIHASASAAWEEHDAVLQPTMCAQEEHDAVLQPTMCAEDGAALLMTPTLLVEDADVDTSPGIFFEPAVPVEDADVDTSPGIFFEPAVPAEDLPPVQERTVVDKDASLMQKPTLLDEDVAPLEDRTLPVEAGLDALQDTAFLQDVAPSEDRTLVVEAGLDALQDTAFLQDVAPSEDRTLVVEAGLDALQDTAFLQEPTLIGDAGLDVLQETAVLQGRTLVGEEDVLILDVDVAEIATAPEAAGVLDARSVSSHDSANTEEGCLSRAASVVTLAATEPPAVATVPAATVPAATVSVVPATMPGAKIRAAFARLGTFIVSSSEDLLCCEANASFRGEEPLCCEANARAGEDATHEGIVCFEVHGSAPVENRDEAVREVLLVEETQEGAAIASNTHAPSAAITALAASRSLLGVRKPILRARGEKRKETPTWSPPRPPPPPPQPPPWKDRLQPQTEQALHAAVQPQQEVTSTLYQQPSLSLTLPAAAPSLTLWEDVGEGGFGGDPLFVAQAPVATLATIDQDDKPDEFATEFRRRLLWIRARERRRLTEAA